MSTISTHVLDTATGKPATGIAIALESSRADGTWESISASQTNDDGRVPDLLGSDTSLLPGNYRLTFETGAYHQRQGIAGFYPQVAVEFHIAETAQHYHVPLLLSPFGYSTYRGS
jgi:5-hydroxyisourate hydrolase